MVDLDEDSLICDLAETYGIHDWKAWPLRYIATLACGLRADSRIVGKMGGVKEQPPIYMLCAHLLDSVNALAWSLCGDKNHRPNSMVERIVAGQKETNGYSSVADFEKARKKILDGIK